MSLYAELKRRNVFRVAAAYIVLGWLLLQVTSILLQFLGAPPWVGKTIVALLVIGFVPSLAIAWVFEVGPDGVQRDDGSTPAANGQHARRLDILTIVGVVIVAAIALAEGLRPPPRATAPAAPSAERATPPTAATQAPAPTTSTRPAPQGSIAVLPFANMSPDPENEYFADGIAEELLNVLSRIDGLKVASRTSAFSFKGSKAPIGEVARTLNVAHVLEGSVRRQGVRVRITAQLIDAATDQHLWSESYDRELDDIFAVQDEIARAIAQALGGALKLDGAARADAGRPTADLVAYEGFLRARTLFHQRGEALLAARTQLEECVARDPRFAEAWALLAAVHAVTRSYGLAPDAESTAAARRAAERAIGLDATLALPHAVLGQTAGEDGELLDGLAHLDTAVRLGGADPSPYLWRAILRMNAGHLADAEADARRAVEMDPLSGINTGWLGGIRWARGDREGGEALVARGGELGWTGSGAIGTALAVADGDRADAARQVERFLAASRQVSPERRAFNDAAIAAAADPAAGADFLARARAQPTPFFDTALMAMLGLHDEAIALALGRDVTGNLMHRVAWLPTGRAMVTRPGYYRVAERDGLVAFWEAKGFPDGCRRVDAPERRLECEVPAP